VSSAAPRVVIPKPKVAKSSPSPPRDVLPRGKALPSKPSDTGVMKNPHAGTEAPEEVAAGAPEAQPPEPRPETPSAPAETDEKPDEPPPAVLPRPMVEQMTAGIRRVVDEHKDSIVDCYRRATKGSASNDPLHGRLEVHLRIVPAGDAEDVRVVQTKRDRWSSAIAWSR